MTRDEAIKAARAGKKVTHKNIEEAQVVCEDNTLYLSYASGNRECFYKVYCIAHPIFDEGWEVVKEKVKKTYWYAAYLNPIDSQITILYDGKPFANKETAQKYTNHYYVNDHSYVWFPIEIEVEE